MIIIRLYLNFFQFETGIKPLAILTLKAPDCLSLPISQQLLHICHGKIPAPHLSNRKLTAFRVILLKIHTAKTKGCFLDGSATGRTLDIFYYIICHLVKIKDNPSLLKLETGIKFAAGLRLKASDGLCVPLSQKLLHIGFTYVLSCDLTY